MKKIFFYACWIICCIMITSKANAARYSIDFTSNEWVNPVEGTMKTDSLYDYLSSTYEENWSNQHTGIDIIAPFNSIIRSIGIGEIYHIKRSSAAEENLSVVYVRHLLDNNNEFTAVYGHCRALDEFNEEELPISVDPDQDICNVKKWGSPIHLHFGININKDIPTSDWGRLAIGIDAEKKGWRDPISFLNTHHPAMPKFYEFFQVYKEGKNFWGKDITVDIAWYPADKSCYYADKWCIDSSLCSYDDTECINNKCDMKFDRNSCLQAYSDLKSVYEVSWFEKFDEDKWYRIFFGDGPLKEENTKRVCQQ